MKLNANDGYPHTADNLDDETIDNLRNEALDADDSKTAEWCRQAVNPRTSSVTRATYRRLLAAHLNAIVESEAC